MRSKACNDDTLTIYFLEVSRIIDVHKIDKYRIANLDETGFSPNKECLRSDHRKRFVTRAIRAQLRSPEFKNIERVTMMPVVFASGCVGRCIFFVERETPQIQIF